MKRIFKLLMDRAFLGLFLFGSAFLQPLSADSIRLNAGFWPGERDPGLEQHLFYDDLFFDDSIGRFDLPWSGKNTNTIYPIEIEVSRKAGDGTLFAALNYTRYLPEYSFIGLYPRGGVFSMVDLVDYRATDIEGELGYELKFDQLRVKPKAGGRSHAESYTYDELTIGSGTYIITLNGGPYESDAQGGFVGADIAFDVTPQISIIAEYAQSSPLFGTLLGEHSGERITAGVIGGSVGYYEYSSEESSYNIDFNRFVLGMEFKANDNLSFNFGIRNEKIKESFPEFYSFSYVITAGRNRGSITLPIFEYFTDSMFYGVPRTTEKGVFFAGISLGLGK